MPRPLTADDNVEQSRSSYKITVTSSIVADDVDGVYQYHPLTCSPSIRPISSNKITAARLLKILAGSAARQFFLAHTAFGWQQRLHSAAEESSNDVSAILPHFVRNRKSYTSFSSTVIEMPLVQLKYY